MERLETMRRNVMGNGLSQCLLCGEVLGFLGSSSVFCKDCRKVRPCSGYGLAQTCCSAALHPGFQERVFSVRVCAPRILPFWARLGAYRPNGLAPRSALESVPLDRTNLSVNLALPPIRDPGTLFIVSNLTSSPVK